MGVVVVAMSGKEICKNYVTTDDWYYSSWHCIHLRLKYNCDKNCPAISTCHHDATQKNNEGDEGHDGTESHEDDDESPEIHKDDEGSNSEGRVTENER